MRTPGRIGGICFVISLLIAACQSPTAEQPASDQLSRFKEETNERLSEISSQLEGLSASERRKELIDLAVEEGAELTLYGVTGLDEMAESIDAFEEETEVTVNYFRAGSEEVLQRLFEEAKADFRGADVVNENGAEMTFLAREDLFAPIDTPAASEIPSEGVHDTWVWSYVDIFAVAWNTKLISPAEAPKTWEEVLTDHKGELLMEVGDVDWFASLVKGYFMDQKGMTEEETLDLFREAARGATFVDGHTFMAELVAAGEFAIAASPYSQGVEQLKDEGAPLAWEPAVTPLVTRPEGVAIHATSEHPAAALLFVEWYLTDGQRIGFEQGRQPASAAIEGGGLPTAYDNIVVDADAVVDEFDKWSSIYDELLQLSGEEVIEE